MAHANPQSTPKKKGGKWKWVVLAIIVLFFMSMCAGLTSDDDEGENGAAGGTTTSEVAPEAEDEVQEEEASLTPEEALVVAIRDEVGDDAEVEIVEGKDVRVNIPITGGWDESSMARGIRNDTIDIIRLVKESSHQGGTPYLRVSATADMVDQMGNSDNYEVIMASYWPETLAEINPDGIKQENVWTVADERWIHPAFQG